MKVGTPTQPDSASRDELVPVLELLHSRQAERGHIDTEGLAEAALAADISETELYGAITAYPRFRLQPAAAKPAVCTGPACVMRGAAQVQAALGDTVESHCLGLCEQPVAVFTEDGPRVARERRTSRLTAPEATEPVVGVPESAFFGADDPFDAVRAALGRSPDELIATVTESGLDGRGGAGFPTGRKWEAVREAPGDRKFVVCNADESEPGTFKDRCLLELQPRRVLAGMVIAAHSVSATAGVIYIRYEYGPQYERLLDEIERLKEERLLGDRFDVVVRRGAGSYVCGEETALLNSLEGQRPIPRDRPPYPTSHGLLGAPTLVQNVETLAAVPAIVSHNPDWYREQAKRAKLYCVSGDVPSPGVFELPMTVTARELLERASAKVDEVKAFTLGGLSGGMLQESALDVRLDFEDPRKYDAFLGSGGVVVVGQSRCIARFALEAMRFFAGSSCGKCFPCRIGTVRLRERLEAVVTFEGLGNSEVRDVMEVLATGSACGLGPAAGLVAEHLLAYFEDEVRAHENGRCPAGECERS